MEGNNLEIVARSLEAGTKLNIADALRQFFSADSKGALVTMGALANHKARAEIASPNFDLETLPECVGGTG